MSCSCRLITLRSVTLARASTRMRRLLVQQQAVRMSLQSCSLITPARSSVCCIRHGVFQCAEGVRQSANILAKGDFPLIAQMIKPAGSGDSPPQVAFCVCWFLFLVFCCFVSWYFVFCFLMNVRLCIGPPPVYFCSHYSIGLCVT